MNTSSLRRLASVAVCCSLIACENQADGPRQVVLPHEREVKIEQVVSAPVSLQELDIALARGNPRDIEYALNEVKSSSTEYEVFERIACAYLVCETRNEGWNSITYESELVRVNLLDVLSQASNNGLISDLSIDFRIDALQLLNSRDPRARRQALLVLAENALPEDIAKIESVAMSASDDPTFRYAILALRLIDSKESSAAIEQIGQRVTGSKLASLDDMLN